MTTLEVIQGEVCSINNNSHTMHWGVHIENNVLVAVCGHPSIPQFRGMLAYLTFIQKDDTITLQCETSTPVPGKDNVRRLVLEKLYPTCDRAEKMCAKLVISVLRDYFKG